MTIYRITYYDKYRGLHSVDIPADDPESAIEALEAGLNEQIEVKTIEILD